MLNKTIRAGLLLLALAAALPVFASQVTFDSQATGPAGSYVVVRVSVDTGAAPLQAFDAWFTFDDSKVDYLGSFRNAFTSDATAGFGLEENVVHQAGDDLVKLGLYAARPPAMAAGYTEVMWLLFRNNGTGSAITWDTTGTEVNGTAPTGFTNGAITTGTGTVLFSMPHNASTTAGGTALVPIYADPAQGLRSFDIQLEFNPAVATVPSASDITTAAATAGWTVTSNTSVPGKVIISLFEGNGASITLTGRQAIAYVALHAVGFNGDTTPLDIVSVVTNDGVTTAYDDGELKIDADADGDGFTVFGGDCNDHDASIHPGATEVVNDGIDQNCDGQELCPADADGDAFGSSLGATATSAAMNCIGTGVSNNVLDCDDGDPSINPNGFEVCNDHKDNNCDGIVDGAGGTRYVVAGGSTTADCTSLARACSTIQRAVDVSCGGETIVVGAGAFNESVSIPKSAFLRGAKFGVAVGTRTPGLGESVVTGTSGAVFSVSSGNVSIDGFDIAGGGAYSGVTAYSASSGFSNVMVSNNFIHDVSAGNPFSSAHVSLGVMAGSGSPGARFPVGGVVVANNRIYAIGLPGTNPGRGVFAYTIQGATPGSGIDVHGNAFSSIAEGGTGAHGAAVGIDIGTDKPDGTPLTPCTGVSITGNTYQNVFAGGAMFATSSVFDEPLASFTNVPLFALTTFPIVNEAALSKYAKTDKPTGFPGSVAYFSTIQGAVSASDPAATVSVTAGTWPEHVTVDAAKTGMALIGPNAGVAGNGVRTAEAVITAVASDPLWSNSTCTFLMSVLASNVTVKGFTFDGDNPALAGGMPMNGANVDACVGLINEADNSAPQVAVSNALVQNNVFRNIAGAAVLFDNAGTSTAGTVIDHNAFDNMDPKADLEGYGIGVYLGSNHYAQVTNNQFRAVRKGVQFENFYTAKPAGPAALISGNDVESTRAGLWYNLHYSAASSWEVTANTLAASAVAPENNRGLWLTSLQQTVAANVHGNAATGGWAGIDAWNVTSTGPITVDDNTVTNAKYGVVVDNTSYSATTNPAHLTVSKLHATGCTTACAAVLEDAATASTLSLVLDDSSLTGAGSSGVLVDGAHASATVRTTEVTGTATGVLVRNGGNADVSTNHIAGNGLGVDNQTSNTVLATCVYWGSATGPGGSNNGVSGLVDVAPFDPDTSYTNFFTFFADADGDLFGSPGGPTISSCAAPPHYVADHTDCDDTNAAINPAALEVCGNGLDDNCDSVIDSAPGSIRYVRTTGSPAADCTTLARACNTIQRAVDQSCGLETIDVGAGLFNESVNVPRPVTIKGAQFGVPVAGRLPGAPTESVVLGTGGAVFNVSSGNVTIDGFDIQGGGAFAGVLAFSGSPYGNVSITNNFIHGVTAGNPNSSSNYSHGILVGSGSRGDRKPVSGITVAGNRIFDLGVAGANPGAGFYGLAIQAGSPGAGASITGNTFSNIASGALLPTPKFGAGVIFDIGQDDASGNATAPCSGVLVSGNTYADVFAGVGMFAASSALNELHSSFTNVSMYAANVGRLTSPFNAAQLAPYAVTNAPAGYPSTDAYFSTIGGAVSASDAGATVTATAGTFAEDGIVVSKSMTLVGQGASLTSIDASASTHTGAVVDLAPTAPNATVSMTGFRVKNGANLNGIAFHSTGATGSTITIGNNTIFGFGPGADASSDFGIIGGYEGVAKVVVTGNTITGTTNNPVLFERHAGESSVADNSIVVGSDGTAAIFYMTYNGLDVITPQVVDHNNITILPTPGSGSNAIVFTIFSDGVTPQGKYTGVKITRNTVSGTLKRTAIGVYEESPDGSASIENPEISHNVVTGDSGSGGRAIGIYDHVVGAKIEYNQVSGMATGIALTNYWSPTVMPSGALIQFNDVTGTATQGIYSVAGSAGAAHGNYVTGKVVNDGAGAFDATCNFWGAATGPTPSQTVGSVVASSWLMENDHNTDLDGDGITSCNDQSNYDCNAHDGLVTFNAFFPDVDSDTYGSASAPFVRGCIAYAPAGYVLDHTDCNDSAFTVHPNATEVVANGIDENCDHLELCYVDGDHDGYGSTATTTNADLACLAAGVANNDGDCDDARAAVHPGAVELCNGIDDNCDNVTDGAAANADCSDGNVCTSDVCLAAACVHTDPSGSCSIAGSLFYGKIDGGNDVADPAKPIQGTTVRLDADTNLDSTIESSFTSVTTTPGQYTFSAINGNDTVAPQGRLLSLAQLSAVSSTDASWIAQYAVRLRSFTPYQLVVADASANGTVSSFDASLVAQLSVGTIQHLPAAGSPPVSDFAYFPVSRNYTPLTGPQTAQDFVTILWGDVTENFDPLTQLSSLAPPAPAGMATGAFGSRTLMAGGNGAQVYLASGPRRTADGHYEVVLGIQNADGILGLDAKLAYDANAVTIQNVRTAQLSQAFTLVQNRLEDGYVLGLFNAEPMQGTGEFLVVTFDTNGPIAGDAFSIEAVANEGQIPLTWGPGTPGPSNHGRGTGIDVNKY